MANITVAMPEQLLRRLDHHINRGAYLNRADAVRQLLKVELEKLDDEERREREEDYNIGLNIS